MLGMEGAKSPSSQFRKLAAGILLLAVMPALFMLAGVNVWERCASYSLADVQLYGDVGMSDIGECDPASAKSAYAASLIDGFGILMAAAAVAVFAAPGYQILKY